MNTPDSSAFKNWPEEVASIYGSLPMPSLHEFVLANEKFAAEMRRHGKDLHKMSHSIIELKEVVQTLEQHFNAEAIDFSQSSTSEESDDTDPLSSQTQHSENEEGGNSAYYPAWEVNMMRQATKIEERQWEEVFIAMLEITLQTMNDQKELQNNVLEILEPVKNAKSARTATTHLFSLHQNKVQSIKDQMMANLKDIDIEPIIPEIDDLYDEDFHRVIESIGSEKGIKHKKNTVARIIRIGYKRHGELVRQADVCVYE